MLNLIILILLIHTVFSNINSSILACGVFAFMSDSKDNLNWDRFNILGVFNDDRGGDSCGRATEDFVEHGIGTNSDYKDLVIGYGSPQTKYKTVLGHARKASVGQVKKEFAQPVVFSGETKFIKKKKGRDKLLKEFFGSNDNSKDKTVFAGVHNGTIINYLALAKQYDIDSTDKNDSGILMEIIYRRGLDVLIDYIGTAALIWYDFTTDTGYAFHGQSAMYATNKGKESALFDEKPLFMYKESANTLYLSSIENSLKFIGGTDATVEELDYNTLYTIKSGQVVAKTIFDRAKLSSQKEPWPEYKAPTNSNYGTTKTYKTYDDWYYNNKYNNDDDLPIVKNHNGIKFNPDLLDGKIHILWEKRDAYVPTDTVFFWKGRYWMSAHLFSGIPEVVSGVHYLDVYGGKCTSEYIKSTLYYFVDGIMLINREAYDKALLLVSKNYTPAEFAREISDYSFYPVHSFDKGFMKGSIISCSTMRVGQYQNFFKPKNNKADCSLKESEDSVFFSGTFKPVFSKRTYVVNRGDLVGIRDDGVMKTNNKVAITLPATTLKTDTDDVPDYPCQHCNLDYSLCDKCTAFDVYNEKLVTIGARSSIKQIYEANDELEAFDRKNIADCDIAYQDLVIDRTCEIVDEGVTGVQDLIDSMNELGGKPKFYDTVISSLEEIKAKYESLKSIIDDEKSV